MEINQLPKVGIIIHGFITEAYPFGKDREFLIHSKEDSPRELLTVNIAASQKTPDERSSLLHIMLRRVT